MFLCISATVVSVCPRSPCVLLTLSLFIPSLHLPSVLWSSGRWWAMLEFWTVLRICCSCSLVRHITLSFGPVFPLDSVSFPLPCVASFWSCPIFPLDLRVPSVVLCLCLSDFPFSTPTHRGREDKHAFQQRVKSKANKWEGVCDLPWLQLWHCPLCYCHLSWMLSEWCSSPQCWQYWRWKKQLLLQPCSCPVSASLPGDGLGAPLAPPPHRRAVWN